MSRFYNQMLALLLCITVLVPAAFTFQKMGLFSTEPPLEILPTANAQNAPILRIATEADSSPNSYYNQKGQLSGLYIEITNAVANRLGMYPVYSTGNWPECRQMLENQQVDLLVGLDVFSSTKWTLRTIPICSDDLRVYGPTVIDSPAALQGKRVSIMARSMISSTYDLGCSYISCFTNEEILRAVDSGAVDFAICPAAVASKLIEREGFQLRPSLDIAISYPTIAMRDANRALEQQINEILEELSNDGTIGRLQQKWITEFTRNKSFSHVVQNNLLFYLLFLSGMMVLLSLCVLFRLLDQRRAQHIAELLEYQKKLEQTTQAAMAASQAKTAFLSHMSHDIRTPMNAIIGYTDIALKRNPNSEVREYLEKISISSNHLRTLMNDVLDISQIESGKAMIHPVPMNMIETADTVLNIIRGFLAQRDLQLHVNRTLPENCMVLGDPLRLREILMNILSNALKFTPDGGSITFTSSARTSPDGTHMIARYEISDTGIGMKPEFAARIFEPFSQEQTGDARTEYRGAGLGMALTKRYVDMMGGTIEVRSVKGEGSTFLVELPLELVTAEQPMREAPFDEAAIRKKLAGIRVLMAEDNDLNAEIATYQLQDVGIRVVRAMDGRLAVDIFAGSPPGTFDLILMDIMMPNMNGLEATRAIRSMPDRPDGKTIPISALTANAFADDVQSCLDAGMDAHLSKPMDMNQMLKTLAKLVP